MKLYVGLDLGLQKTAVCAVDEKGETIFRRTIVSEAETLLNCLSKYKDDIKLVGLEACPLSEWLHAALIGAGYKAFCLETRHTQRFLSTRPNKTDRTDAHGIATMMRVGHFKEVHVKSEESQLMRAMLTGRKRLVGAMLQIENTIRGLLRIRGLKIGKVHRNQYSTHVEMLCADHQDILAVIMPLLRVRNEMREQMRTLDLALGRAARNDSVCKKFLAIPGVGPLTSLAFKATIDDPRRFASSRTVPSHLGLTPRVYQSGEIDRSGHISKSGDKLLRYLLVEAATAMLLRSKKWCSIKSWGVRLAKRVGMSKAIVAVARKIAIVMHKIWLTGDDFRFGEASPPASASVA